MKRNFTRYILSTLLLVALTVGLSSCENHWYDPDWGPDYDDYDTFYDQDLLGGWMLYDVNGQPVRGTDVNYLEFSGRGRGLYYYYQNGRLFYEDMNYLCYHYYYDNDYEIAIQYSTGSPERMTYWFGSRDDLYMEWRTGGGYVRYHYVYVNDIP